MNRMLLFCLSIALVSIACKKPKDTFGAGEAVIIKWNTTRTFKSGDAEFEVKFTDLIEESRCPEGTNCFWAGRAIIQLTIDKKDIVRLGIGDLQPPFNGDTIHPSEFYGKYNISLVDLSFGKESNYGDKSKYAAKILIE
jgi:hypothetical protein